MEEALNKQRRCGNFLLLWGAEEYHDADEWVGTYTSLHDLEEAYRETKRADAEAGVWSYQNNKYMVLMIYEFIERGHFKRREDLEEAFDEGAK